MKKQDIAIIIAVVFFAAVFSLLVSKVLFQASSKNLTAEVVEPISPDFHQPDPRVFNDQAINPTQLIKIGDTSNPQPF